MKQNKIPPGWLNVKLGEVIELKYGKALPAQKRDGEKFPVYGSNGIVGYHSEPQIEGPALIVGRKGSIGEVHLSEEDCSCIDTTYFVDDFYGQPPVFWLNRLRCLNLAELNRATALPGLNRNDAYQLNLLFPPLKEQHRIVKKIEALQTRSINARKALEAIPPLLEKFRQSVLASAFRGDLTADWRAQNPDIEPAEKLLERIRQERRKRWEEAELVKMKARGQTPKDDKWKKKYKEPEPVDTTNLSGLPEGWCWARWEEVGFCQNGRAFPSKQYSSEGVKLLRPGNLHVSGDVEWNESNTRFMPKEWEEKYPFYVIGPNELVINLTAQSLKDEFLGRICLTHAGEHCLLNQRIARLTPIILNPKFILFLLKSPYFRQYVDSLNTGTLIQHMFSSQIDNFVLPLPPQGEQEVIQSLMESLLAKNEKIAEQVINANEQIGTIDQSILAKAFRGELVPQDPNDESASKLLELIKKGARIGQISKRVSKGK